MEKKRRQSWWFWIGVWLILLSWLRLGDAYAEVVDRIRDDLYAAHFITAEEGWVVGSNGGIYYTTDRGKTWEKQFSDTTEALYAVRFFADGKAGWISGKSGLLLRTTDGGQKWLPAFSDTWHHLFSLDFVDPQHGVVVGDRGTILLTRNGGKTWQDRSVEDVVLYGVKLHSSGRGRIVGERGTVLLTENGGDRWERMTTGNTSTLQAVAFADEHWGCAVGVDGTILQSADGGRTWRLYKSPVQTSLYNVAISGRSGWVVGDEGVILNSTDAGRTWKLVQGPDELLRFKFLGLFMSPDSLGVITGTQGLVLFAQGDQVDLAPVVHTREGGSDEQNREHEGEAK